MLVEKYGKIESKKMQDFLKQLDIPKSLYKTNKDFGLVTVKFPELKPFFLFK